MLKFRYNNLIIVIIEKLTVVFLTIYWWPKIENELADTIMYMVSSFYEFSNTSTSTTATTQDNNNNIKCPSTKQTIYNHTNFVYTRTHTHTHYPIKYNPRQIVIIDQACWEMYGKRLFFF